MRTREGLVSMAGATQSGPTTWHVNSEPRVGLRGRGSHPCVNPMKLQDLNCSCHVLPSPHFPRMLHASRSPLLLSPMAGARVSPNRVPFGSPSAERNESTLSSNASSNAGMSCRTERHARRQAAKRVGSRRRMGSHQGPTISSGTEEAKRSRSPPLSSRESTKVAIS